MSARPTNVTVRADLTQYAYGLMQDIEPALRLAKLLAPVVPTGGMSGLYNKFDDTAAFKAYAANVSRRPIGGHAQEIGLLTDTANFNCQPNGLRIKIDEAERLQAGSVANLLEQAKVRTLTIQSALSFLSNVLTVIKAAVSAASGKGTWLDGNVDPIQEINAQIKAVFLATGMIPNHIVFDFGSWCVFADNPKVLARMPGADVAQVSPARIQRLFVNPSATVEIVETAVLTGGGLGNSSATKVSVMGGSVLIFFNNPLATQYDPSFCKTFSPSANLFTEVFSYREEPHFDCFENDWTSQTVVVAASLCKRIDVTGANT
jgi:hypothetical protein